MKPPGKRSSFTTQRQVPCASAKPSSPLGDRSTLADAIDDCSRKPHSSPRPGRSVIVAHRRRPVSGRRAATPLSTEYRDRTSDQPLLPRILVALTRPRSSN